MRNFIIIGLLILALVAFTYYEASMSPAEIANAYHAFFGESLAAKPIKYPYPQTSDTKTLYLDLMKLALTDSIYESPFESRAAKQKGNMYPSRALTMVGLRRLDNIQACMNDVLKNKIPGDFIEAGAWRGGATIFMRALLKANNETTRKIWVADSFEGLPKPDNKNYPADARLDLSALDSLAVSEEMVKDNFQRFGLLDKQVIFLKGFFKDSLPDATIDKLAVLRVDADLYESTLEALTYLYPKISAGGYVIVDDYGNLEPCRKATIFYREMNSITEPIVNIDGMGIYWQKSK